MKGRKFILKGLLITFEGIDFCGKSIQSKRLFERLQKSLPDEKKDTIILVREPGGTEISERIRRILLDRSLNIMDPVTELLLYEAARSQLIAEVILPGLKKGMIVICDRFYDSTTAYQGYGRSLNLEMIQRAHQIATHGVVPDVTFLIDLDPEVAKKRQKLDGRSRDRLEMENLEFHRCVREGFLQIARTEPERIKVVDGNQAIDRIAQEVWNILESLIDL